MIKTQHIDDELSAFRKRYGVAAVGAAIVTRDGPTTIRVSGNIHRNSQETVLPVDQWHIGSCAKAITAALYARLVETGTTTWDASLGSFFPDLEPHHGWMERTVAEALTCQAGIRPNPSHRQMEAAYGDTRPQVQQRLDAARSALSDPPRAPGHFLYSNLGYILVGSIIDRVTGTGFETALSTLLLDPLGLSSAAFGPPPRIWGHAPGIHVAGLVIGRGAPTPPDDLRSDNPPLLTPAGRLHLNLEDWARFHQVFLAGGVGLLSPKTVDLMLATPPGGRMAMGWAPTKQLKGALLGMQGSNAMWSASALVADDRSRTAMVVANDGRTRVLTQTAYLAHRLLTQALDWE